jgi:hypothetical protein
LNRIFLTVIELVKQAWAFPHLLIQALQQRRRQSLFNQSEAERLDRIRQPWKYQGK